MEWEYVAAAGEDEDLSGSLLVVGMPSQGNVGPIAAKLLVEHLDMRSVGSFQSDALPPAAIAWKGVVTGPIQVFATAMACGLDGRCDRLLVLSSDVQVPPEQMMGLAGAITRWAKRRGISMVVGIDGYAVDDETPDQGTVCAANVIGAAHLEKLAGTRIHAMLFGFPAALMVRANRDRLAAVAFLSPVTDAGAASPAVSVISAVDPLVPNIPMAPDELRSAAQELDTRLVHEKKQQERGAKRVGEMHRGYV